MAEGSGPAPRVLSVRDRGDHRITIVDLPRLGPRSPHSLSFEIADRISGKRLWSGHGFSMGSRYIDRAIDIAEDALAKRAPGPWRRVGDDITGIERGEKL